MLSDRQARVVALAEAQGVAWSSSPPEQLRAASGSAHHQGVAAVVSRLPDDRLETVVRDAGLVTDSPLVVLLDGIVDPTNLGTIIRTAHCAGVHAVVVPNDRAAGATPLVSKISAGALEHTRLCRVTNLAGTMQWLKKRGFWVAGLAMEAEQTLFQADLRGSLALVIGGEGKGLRRLVRSYCDFIVSIPMQGRVNALNASAAAAIVLYEAFRQRCTD